MASGVYKHMREMNPDLPKRIGVSWSQDEEVKMLQLLEDGKSRQEIGVLLERTDGGIRSRLNKIAYEMYVNGIPRDNILKATGITDKSLSKIIIKKQKNDNLSEVLFEIRDLLKKIADKD